MSMQMNNKLISMRGIADTVDMTDRELRAYRRKQRLLRERRRRIATFLLTVMLVFTGIFSYHALTSEANDKGNVSLKYYTGIIVQRGDTLWSIADDYIDYDQYRSKQAYIDEVCSINNLYDESEIHAGQRLVVPYFSTEYIR